MKSLFALFLLPLALIACAKSDGGNDSTPAAPVAAAAAPAGQNWTDTVVKTDEGYLMGNPNAPIKLVEYGARLCPACKLFATTSFEPLMKNYVSTGKVSFEFRDFLIHGPAELGLAVLGRCGPVSSFFPILEQTYANQDAINDKAMKVAPALQQSLQGKSPAQIITGWTEAVGGIDFVKQRGIPEAKARACLADEKAMDALTDVTQKRGQDGTVTGTPTILINDKKVNGISWTEIEPALKAAGA